MFKFFRKIRQNLLLQNRVKKYLLYAIGEIILVVVGILIAVSIDNWNQEKELEKAEIENYQDIVNDLKKDSIRFDERIRNVKMRLDVLHQLNEVTEGRAEILDHIYYEIIVILLTWDPITQNNHQTTIENLRNDEVRSDLNSYFQQQQRATIAVDEFNYIITKPARAYLMEEKSLFSKEKTFAGDKYVFPALSRQSLADKDQLKAIASDKQFHALLIEERMSLGWFLFELEKLHEQNAKLIQKLTSKLNWCFFSYAK